MRLNLLFDVKLITSWLIIRDTLRVPSLSLSLFLFFSLFKYRSRAPNDSKRNVFFPTTCLWRVCHIAHAYVFLSPVNWATMSA